MTNGVFQVNTSDPQYLILHEEGHMKPSDYRLVMERWIARLTQYEDGEQPVRFGVMIVHGHHQHDNHDEAHERDGDEEADFSKLLNAFRRDYRQRIRAVCTGYANVYTTEDIEAWYGQRETGLAKLHERMARFSQYNFGIPAGVFTDVASAKAWLAKEAQQPQPPAVSQPPQAAAPNKGVGLFYGSTTGTTEYVAEQLAQAWQAVGQPPLTCVNICEMETADELLAYERLILGIPTWNVGQLQDDWDDLMPSLQAVDFSHKQVALFGVGDAFGYPDNFLDAVGMLGQTLRQRGATLVGYWPTEGYDFGASKALENGQFMGLAIDEANEAGQTEARINRWVRQLVQEFALEPTTVEV